MAEQTKRTQIKSKVAAAEQRNKGREKERSYGDYARDAASEATSFVKQHPIATVAGGLVLGALVASFLPGGRKVRKQASARSAVLATTLAELALTYGTKFLDGASEAAKTGQDKLGDFGDALGDGANRAARGAGSLADGASDNAREIGRSAVKTLRDLRTRMTH